MKTFQFTEIDDIKNVLQRPVQKMKNIKKVVKPIIKKVIRKGDKALIKFAWEYDHVDLENLIVTEKEFAQAEKLVSEQLKNAIQIAKDNIETFHKAQVQEELVVETMPGVMCSRKSVPITSVGLYVPGGTAPLFSTVLMLGIPAKIAGCKEIVLCTPPNSKGEIHPAILYTAKLIGIDTVVKVGGAQAIAAMAYGTKSVPKVSKIFGPGNQYVTAAKQIVSQTGIAIDMPAGPSEVLVYADESAIPDFVASDLLSQAEHGVDSQVVLVAKGKEVVVDCIQAINEQLNELARKNIAQESLKHCVIIEVENDKQAIEIINYYAPEHLILSVFNDEEIAGQVENAGSVFLGHFTPESAGDYASGTNHTLPTNGAALAFSGVSVDSFVKKITYQKISDEGLMALGPVIEEMAAAEQLGAHKNAVTIRLNYINESKR